MLVVCLDMEGVLVPEIWIEVSKRTGIVGLSRTTRDEPDYDKLMRYRLGLLAQHKLRLADIQAVIAEMRPFEGARELLDALRARHQVVILSDTFYDFARPLMARFGWPTLLCHRLLADENGFVAGYRLRIRDQKRAAVESFRGLNFATLAVGDSYNDVSMLAAADTGIFYHPPQAIAVEYPQFRVVHSYAELEAAIEQAASALPA